MRNVADAVGCVSYLGVDDVPYRVGGDGCADAALREMMTICAMIGAWALAACVGGLCVAPAMAGSHGGSGSSNSGSSGQGKPPTSAKPSDVVGGALTAGKVAVP